MLKPILLVVLLPFTVFSLELSSALKSNQIKALVTSNGDYSGLCIDIQIQNKSEENIEITIEPGTRFHSSKYTEQDIIITRSKSISINPSQTINTRLNGYCCQANYKAPDRGSIFNNVSITKDTLYRLCKFLNENHYDTDIEQSAVWCLSDNKALYSIHYNQTDSIEPLLEFLSLQTGKEYPSYQVEYWTDENHLTSNRPTSLNMTFDYKVLEDGLSSIILYDQFGTAVRSLIIDHWHTPGDYLKEIKWTGNIRRGNFKLVHYHNGEIQKKKDIVI